jgi:hypothetical protein
MHAWVVCTTLWGLGAGDPRLPCGRRCCRGGRHFFPPEGLLPGRPTRPCQGVLSPPDTLSQRPAVCSRLDYLFRTYLASRMCPYLRVRVFCVVVQGRAACIALAVAGVLALAAARPAVDVPKFPVHRLAQFDSKLVSVGGSASEQDGGEGDDASPVAFGDVARLGSRQAAVSLVATAASKSDDGKTGRDDLLSRRVAVVHLEDMDFQRFVALVRDRRAGALLVILPSADHLAEVRTAL